MSTGLQTAAGYSWRLLIVGIALYVIYRVLLRFELVCTAVFLAFVLTSLLRPPVNAMSRVLPRPLAVVISIIGGLALIGAIGWLLGISVADQSSSLSTAFRGGVGRIERWLQGAPFHVKPTELSNLQDKITSFITAHRSTLISQALSGASRAVEIVTVVALSFFCTIFFTNSGDRMWGWMSSQVPEDHRLSWDAASTAAWRTFAGYTRGVIIVSAANASMVCVALLILRVPLALPLTVLEFFASFIPLVGSPIALAVATVVALAGRGVVVAVIVLALIVVIGQIEGHVLQPLVMGWAVRLHPVVVAVSVIAATTLAGVLGAVVAVPIVSVAWAVYRELRELREEGEPDELGEPDQEGSPGDGDSDGDSDDGPGAGPRAGSSAIAGPPARVEGSRPQPAESSPGREP